MAKSKRIKVDKSQFEIAADQANHQKVIDSKINITDFYLKSAARFELIIGLNKVDENGVTLLERIEKITSDPNINGSVNDWILEGLISRVARWETHQKKLNSVKNDADKELENLIKQKTYGTSMISLKNRIAEIKAYNATQKDAVNRIYLSPSAVKKDQHGLGEFRVNSKTLKRYFDENLNDVIKYNLGQGVFEEAIRYTSKAYRKQAKAIAAQFGYKG